jgi:hypothetical protein
MINGKTVYLYEMVYAEMVKSGLAQPLKSGERIGFKDGNPLNCTNENLIVVKKQ